MAKMKDSDSRKGIGIFGSVPVYALPLINSINELKALVAISSYQRDKDEAYPSLETLSKRIGISPAATSVAISGLVRKEIIARKRNYGRNNTYTVLHETESMIEIKAKNRDEKKKERAKRLSENIEKSQSFESLEYSKGSNHEHSNSSNVEHSNSSNDILKEHIKRTELKEQEIVKPLNITQQLKDFAQSNNLSYEINPDEDRKSQSKLVTQLSLTNEQVLKQVERLKPILADSKCDWWSKTNSFGFNYMLKNWGRIDSWHNANKPKVREFKKPEIAPAPVKFSETHLDTLKEFLA